MVCRGADFPAVQQRQPAGGEVGVDQQYAFARGSDRKAPNVAVRLVLPDPPLALAIQMVLADM
jgi:hypothetical protein